MTAALELPWRVHVVRGWLFAIAALTFAMVLVGGATRGTESGLSMVEWRPITGTLPPRNESEWRAEFERYQRIPQFRVSNPGMTLPEFKTIYWWEWAHRLLGRVIGAAFLLPFLFFLARGWIEPRLRPQLWGIFCLGALQGAVGWWMVSSGLADRTEVSPYRLATHLILACIIFAATVWTARAMVPPVPAPSLARHRSTALGMLLLVFLQIYLGALLAGLRGGLVYDTWPLMGGNFVPPISQLLFDQPLWRNLFENTVTVQFEHRMTAYGLWLISLVHLTDMARTFGFGRTLRSAAALFAGITLQASLGILVLLDHVPLLLALAHQGMAIVVLALAVGHSQRLLATTLGSVAEVGSRFGPARGGVRP
jgi:heme a synthase